ncbi:PAAR domain-containing protein [Paraburkholderia tagetis]|uniref:PAAR domain-containing protein n=1 Tax=Paraburkholderia tagetis TaxID=2913261 RepID=A0A9X1RTA0_9BURK|nr:PAAR domain-containing protein [Paraburkholderia tagetis]MCG5075672.1 PAAR domain-containing protein [Paraburkholderia tagetis]
MVINFFAGAPITVGASLSHGGEVLEGNVGVAIAGHPVATKGARCQCDLHGATIIKTASGRVMVNGGGPVAITGDVTDCGAYLTALEDVGRKNQEMQDYSNGMQKYSTYNSMSPAGQSHVNGSTLNYNGHSYVFTSSYHANGLPTFVNDAGAVITMNVDIRLFMILFGMLPISAPTLTGS